MIKFVQISDCHLFADPDGQHFGAKVYPQLKDALTKINQLQEVDFVVFTGDLTQDHTRESYQLFNQAIADTRLSTPVYYLAGNHDDPELLESELSAEVFDGLKSITRGKWQIQLVNSKSQTPAGWVDDTELKRIANLDNTYFQCLLMHHHPVDVGYFIDRHGMKNQSEFWHAVNQAESISVIACGHVHRGMKLSVPQSSNQNIALYTSPATSITFAKHEDELVAEYDDIGYRVFELNDNGTVSSYVQRIHAVL